MGDFVTSIKLRELTDDEVKSFNLEFSYGGRAPCFFSDTSVVWAAALKENSPTYRLYNRGTNELVVMRYTPDTDLWEKITLEEIDNLYGFIWKMTVKPPTT